MTREEKAQSLGQEYFPDESNIWARANYEAQWVADACIKMAGWEHKRLVNKACEWLKKILINKEDEVHNNPYVLSVIHHFKDELISDFRKAMEE